MRAKRPTRPEAAATTHRDGGRPGRGWLPRPRSAAAAGALLVQLWGLALGATGAQAATTAPRAGPSSSGVVAPTAHRSGPADNRPLFAGRDGTGRPEARHPTSHQGIRRPVRQEPGMAASPAPDARPEGGGPGRNAAPGPAGEPAAAVPGLESPAAAVPVLESPVGAVPVLESPVGAVAAPADPLLQGRIRAGELPLPGQGTAVPDAFVIASVLHPLTPPDPHDGGPRASGDVTLEADDAAPPPPRPGDPETTVPSENSGAAALSAALASGGGTGLAPAPGPRDGLALLRSAADRTAAADGPGIGALYLPAARRHPQTPAVNGEATVPLARETTGTSAAVLVPIAAGLLLTGAAMYKHRGLPRGH